MSSEHSWELLAANNIQRRAVGRNWTIKNRRRDYAKKICLNRTHSTRQSIRNLPQRIRMEPARKEITWTPQSHLEAHCFGGMRENIIWRTTRSSQKPPPMETERLMAYAPMEYGYKISKSIYSFLKYSLQ
jgi:hypothetical protein